MSAPERRADGAQIGALQDIHVVPDETPPLDDVVLIPDDVVAVPEVVGRPALATYRRIAALLAGLDALAILATLAIVTSTHLGWSPEAAFVMLGAPLVWGAVFHSFGLYAVRNLSASEEFRRVISATTLGVVLILVASVWWQGSLTRGTLALTWLIALLLELVIRRIVRWHAGRLRIRGELGLRTLIVGTNDEARTIEEVLEAPVGGYEPIGLVQASGGTPGRGSDDVVGGIDDLPALIEQTSAECVFVASTGVTAADVFLTSRACRQANIDMRVSANTREVLTSRVSVQQVQDLMVLAVRSAKLTPTQAALKRAFDLVISSIALVVFAPVMLVVAAAVRLTSPGPVLFRQQRVTKDGRTFTLYKFRTMVVDAERLLDEELIAQAYFKMRDDPRLTPVGGFLRASSLDELPQLWNVIRGDMSLVGPRPLAKEQVDANLELLDPRHEVRAGLTGWWQINGRSEVDVKDALKMDLFYIENWSLALDLYVLLKTVGVVLLGKGAY